LIQYGADITTNYHALLSEAIEKNYYEIVRCLLENGAEVDKQYFRKIAVRHMDFIYGTGAEREHNILQATKIIELFNEDI
jgi:ankyrin repeat protein